MSCQFFIFYQETAGGRKLSAVCINGIETGLEELASIFCS